VKFYLLAGAVVLALTKVVEAEAEVFFMILLQFFLLEL
jgi:hypothetical protein